MTTDANNSTLVNANALLRALLSRVRDALPASSTEAVLHYLDHDEYEMAFEGLFLDLMEAGVFPPELSPNDFVLLGQALGVDREQVFSTDFWPAFLAFAERMTNR